MRFGRPPKLTTDQIALGERVVGAVTSVREAVKLLRCYPPSWIGHCLRLVASNNNFHLYQNISGKGNSL